MTDSFEHDTEEEAQRRTEARPRPDEPEPHIRALQRQDIKELRHREDRPWNHWGNPELWTMIAGEAFDDNDDEDEQPEKRYREYAQ